MKRISIRAVGGWDGVASFKPYGQAGFAKNVIWYCHRFDEMETLLLFWKDCHVWASLPCWVCSAV